MTTATTVHRTPKVLSVTTMLGDTVVNPKGEKLGKIEELMIDNQMGRVAYAVLSFGGFMGMGDKLFAIPFQALRLDGENNRFLLDVPKEKLEKAPGFDKDNWPKATDRTWGEKIYAFYGVRPYWETPVNA